MNFKLLLSISILSLTQLTSADIQNSSPEVIDAAQEVIDKAKELLVTFLDNGVEQAQTDAQDAVIGLAGEVAPSAIDPKMIPNLVAESQELAKRGKELLTTLAGNETTQGPITAVANQSLDLVNQQQVQQNIGAVGQVITQQKDIRLELDELKSRIGALKDTKLDRFSKKLAGLSNFIVEHKMAIAISVTVIVAASATYVIYKHHHANSKSEEQAS